MTHESGYGLSVGPRRLGVLQSEIMDVLWDEGEWLTPAIVSSRLGRTRNYMTVMTVLVRLVDKGIVMRSRSDRGFVYRGRELGISRAHGAGIRRVVSRMNAGSWTCARRGWLWGLLAILIVSCGSGETATPTTPGAGETSNQDLVAQGAPLYAANCAECHGADLRGTERGPSHLSIVYEPDHHGDAVFALAVRNGVRAHHWNFGPMLPVDGLSELDIDAIVAFVRSEQVREGFEPYP